MQILRSLDQECLHLIQSARAFTETDVNNFPLSLRQKVMSRLKVPGERHSKTCPRCCNAVLMMSNILLYTSRDLAGGRELLAMKECMYREDLIEQPGTGSECSINVDVISFSKQSKALI